MRGRTTDEPPKDHERLTVAQASSRLGITEGAVRSRIKRGTLPTVREGSRVYVLLGSEASGMPEANQPTHGGEPSGAPRDQSELVEAQRDEISHLRRESERKDAIIMSLSQANAEQARTLRALEAPSERYGEATEERDAPETVEEAPEGSEPRPDAPDAQEHDADTLREWTNDVERRRPQEGTRRPWWRRVFGG